MGLLEQWRSEGTVSLDVERKLSCFLDLLMEWNRRINLTGLRSRSESEKILVGESVLAARACPLGGKSVLDIGSGAGVPGLIWLILDPSIRLTSLDVREKKIAFQREVVRRLELRAEILKGRFPDAVAGRLFDVIATRAVRMLPAWQKRAAELLNPGGLFLRFATPEASEVGWERIPLSERSSLLVRKI